MDAQQKQTALIVGCVLVGIMVYSYVANQPTGEVVATTTTPDAGLPHDDEQPASQSGSGEMPTQYANGTAP